MSDRMYKNVQWWGIIIIIYFFCKAGKRVIGYLIYVMVKKKAK